MIYQKFIPEGWNDNECKYTKEELGKAYKDKQVLQGIIGHIDSKHNVHINLGDNIEGIIPQSEVGILSKDNKYVQFKVKEINEQNGDYILSRNDVKNESIDWAINLNEGDTVKRNCQKYQVIWCFCRNRRWSNWAIICK